MMNIQTAFDMDTQVMLVRLRELAAQEPHISNLSVEVSRDPALQQKLLRTIHAIYFNLEKERRFAPYVLEDLAVRHACIYVDVGLRLGSNVRVPDVYFNSIRGNHTFDQIRNIMVEYNNIHGEVGIGYPQGHPKSRLGGYGSNDYGSANTLRSQTTSPLNQPTGQHVPPPNSRFNKPNQPIQPLEQPRPPKATFGNRHNTVVSNPKPTNQPTIVRSPSISKVRPPEVRSLEEVEARKAKREEEARLEAERIKNLKARLEPEVTKVEPEVVVTTDDPIVDSDLDLDPDDYDLEDEVVVEEEVLVPPTDIELDSDESVEVIVTSQDSVDDISVGKPTIIIETDEEGNTIQTKRVTLERRGKVVLQIGLKNKITRPHPVIHSAEYTEVTSSTSNTCEYTQIIESRGDSPVDVNMHRLPASRIDKDLLEVQRTHDPDLDLKLHHEGDLLGDKVEIVDMDAICEAVSDKRDSYRNCSSIREAIDLNILETRTDKEVEWGIKKWILINPAVFLNETQSKLEAVAYKLDQLGDCVVGDIFSVLNEERLSRLGYNRILDYVEDVVKSMWMYNLGLKTLNHFEYKEFIRLDRHYNLIDPKESNTSRWLESLKEAQKHVDENILIKMGTWIRELLVTGLRGESIIPIDRTENTLSDSPNVMCVNFEREVRTLFLNRSRKDLDLPPTEINLAMMITPAIHPGLYSIAEGFLQMNELNSHHLNVLVTNDGNTYTVSRSWLTDTPVLTRVKL